MCPGGANRKPTLALKDVTGRRFLCRSLSPGLFKKTHMQSMGMPVVMRSLENVSKRVSLLEHLVAVFPLVLIFCCVFQFSYQPAGACHGNKSETARVGILEPYIGAAWKPPCTL